MSENDLRQAVLLIKAGKKAEAQHMLKTLLENDLHNIHAWVWYVETLPSLQQKIRALEMCSRYNPDNERVIQGLEVLRNYQSQSLTGDFELSERELEGQSTCPHCGTRVQGWADICSYCGSSLRSRRGFLGISIPSFDFSLRLPPLRTILRGLTNYRSWAMVLLFIVPAIGLCLIGYWFVQRPEEFNNSNKLAIGESAKVMSISLSIQPSMEFDFKSADEVLGLRRGEIYRYPELVFSGYEPFNGVFDKIVDGLPWWGIAGQFYYGPGDQSIEGPSEESRFILNPYLLVAAEPCGMWDKTRVPESAIQRPGFPFYCAPTQLQWEPKNNYAELSYDAACVVQRNYACFNLIAYNARDLNLGYLYVSYNDSPNISKTNPPASAYAIPQYIHQGDSCGYPGGCNNMSPATPEIDGLSVVGVPAKAEIWLWKDNPASLDIPPDMTFVIHFR